MREIKFRVWDVDRKTMFYDVLRLTENGIEKWVSLEKRTSENVLWLQYTGLKDTNGVEVYEGDIVNFHIFTQELGLNMGVQEGEKEFKGFICFEELGLAFKQSEEDEEWFYLVYSPGMIHEESFEVIGNIYSNPDLLK